MIGLILAGGSGTRLWPLSRSLYAKQFLSFNSRWSMLQDTVRGASTHCKDLYVVTNEDQYFLVKHQLEELGVPDEKIIIEPVPRNTAAAIALGSKVIEEDTGEVDILTLPSDHIIDDSFYDLAGAAAQYAKDYICIFGVKPTYPSTGYGYIKVGAKSGEGYMIEGFFEKPSLEDAKKYLSEGGFYWNSGIFLFNTSRIFTELERYLPEVYSRLGSSSELIGNYQDVPSISIDYGVMEKTKNIMVFPFEKGWRDVGSWSSVYDILDKDDRGNALKGDVITVDGSENLVMGDERLITLVGVNDLAIVDTKDALLVADKTRADEVRGVVDLLKREGRSEASLHATVYRPWGYYTVLESGHRYKVKRIAVYPGKTLSLQLHHHRAEHWIVVKGTATITKEAKTIKVHENESIYVPKSVKHRVANPGKVDLHIIEVQTGEYVEEDDIERFDDEYGRV